MTEQFNALKASRYVSQRVMEAEAHGISLELLSDFDHLREVVNSTEGRAPLTPIFDSLVSDISSENGFWILGRGADGTVLHVQAIRRDVIRGESLAEHLAARGAWFMSAHIPAIPAASDYAACRYVRAMQGVVCHHGEVWLNPAGQVRGKGMAVCLPRLGLALALMRWQPDYIYGFVHPDLVLKGIPARYGYTHFHPHGIRWRRKDGQGTLDEFITWMTLDDMRDLIEVD